MKYFAKGILVILALVVVFAISAPLFIDLNRYKGEIISIAKDKTGLNITVDGDLSVSVLPVPSFSIKDVRVSEKDDRDVLTFDLLSVNVDFMPLLSGNIAVNAIELGKPVLKIVKDKSGEINLTRILNNINAVKTPEDLGANDSSEPNKGDVSAIPNISFNIVRIEDGLIEYMDETTKKSKALQNLNAKISAKTLLGPYKASGSLFHDGLGLDFNLKTNNFDPVAKTISPEVSFSVAPYGFDAMFAGALDISGSAPALQGHLEAELKDTAAFLKSVNQGLIIKGIVSVNDKRASLTGISGNVGKREFTGEISYDIVKQIPKIKLKTKEAIKLKDFGLTQLPYEMLSFDIDATGDQKQVSLNRSSVRLDQDEFNLAGTYRLDNPRNEAALKLHISSKNIDLDQVLGLKTSKDKVQSASTQNSAAGAKPKTAIEPISISSPLWIDLVFEADTIRFMNAPAKNVKLELSMNGSNVNLKNAEVGVYVGASAKIVATADLKSYDNIEAFADIRASDPKKLLTHFNINADSLPKSLDKSSVKVKVKGDKSKLDLTANIEAVRGELIAKGIIEDPLNKIAAKNLVVQIKHKNMAQLLSLLAGADLSDPNLSRPLDLYMQLDQNGKTYSISSLKGDLSGATVQGAIDVNVGTSVPSVTGALVFGDIKMHSVVTPKGAATNASSSSSGQGNKNANRSSSSQKTAARWSKENINVAALHGINIDMDIKAKSIVYGAWPLQSPSVNMKLKDGNLDIKNLKAGVFGGDIDMNAQVKTLAQPRQPIHFTSDSTFSNVDIGALSTALIGTKLVKISGQGDLNLSITSSGSSAAALVHDLSGNGAVNGKNIVLDGVDVVRFVRALSDDSKPGDTVLGLWKGSTKGGQTHFETLVGDFKIMQGVVTLNKMDLDGPRAAIETRGSINLPNWTLSTKHKMIAKGTQDAPSDIPAFEITFNGSLDNPAQTFGQGLLQDYLNRKIQRKFNKILLDNLGVPTNDNKNQQNVDGETQPEQNAPDFEDAAEEAIKGVLDNLFR